MVELGRARAQALGWPDAYAFTKSLGEVALRRVRGRPPGHLRATLDRRVGARRAPSRVDPRLPDGRAGHHLLRPGPAPPVPRRPRRASSTSSPSTSSSRRSSPWRPRAPSPTTGPTVYQVASGVRNPLRYGTARRPRASSGSPSDPLYDNRGQPIVVPKWSFPGRGKVQGELRRATQGPARRRAARQRAPDPGRARREGGPHRGAPRRRPSGPSATSSSTAPTPRPRRAFASTGPLALFDEPRRRRPGSTSASTRPSSTGARYIERRPPALGRRARPGAHHAGASGRWPSREERSLQGDPLRPSPAAPPSTSRTPSSPRTSSRPTPGWRPATSSRAERARLVAGLLAEGPRLLRLDRRDRSDFLRSFYRRYEGAPVDQLRVDACELFSDLLGSRGPSPRPSPGCARHRALGHRTLLITGALDFVVEPLRPLFDEIVCAPHRRARTASSPASSTDSPPTGEARAILLDEFGRAPTASTSATPSPTRTRRATCRCSRPPASPSSSTPSRSWPPSPAGAAGRSSTGSAPAAARGAARRRHAPPGVQPRAGHLAHELVRRRAGR